MKHFINWKQTFFIEKKSFEGKKNVISLKSEDNIKIKITTDKEFIGKPIFNIKTTTGIFTHTYDDTF